MLELAKGRGGPFYVPFILSKGNYFEICVLSTLLVY